jgi:hypothetical protein
MPNLCRQQQNNVRRSSCKVCEATLKKRMFVFSWPSVEVQFDQTMFMYRNRRSNTTYIDSFVTRLHASTMKHNIY